MKKLLELTENFSVSRPVFRLTKRQGSNTIEANMSAPVYRYRPTYEEGDILAELVCDNYQEQFRDGEFTIDKRYIATSAMRQIRNNMAIFLEKNLEMRNPRQSKVYRWYYRNLPHNDEFDNALIMVYKYLRSFSDENLRSNNIEHTKNAIALLDAIMEKYDER